MKSALLTVALTMLAACSPVSAKSFDPTDPFQCGIAFSVTHALAQNSASSLEKELSKRMRWAAQEAARLPLEQRTREEGENLVKWSSAHPEEAANNTIACMKDQDKKPAFLRFMEAR